MTKGTRANPAQPVLVDNKVLGQQFCQRFIKKLKSFHRRGKLELEGNCAFLQDAAAGSEFTESLVEHDWCVCIERPPTAESTPEHVLQYLARYMSGGPISDRRLVSCEADMITFLARSKDKHKPKRQLPVKLSGVEFTQRWSLHILPKGFTKTRCDGIGMEQALLDLLRKLESIEADHDGLGDTNVREHMSDDVFRGFLRPCPGFSPSGKYGLSAEAHALVGDVLRRFCSAATAAAKREGLQTFHQRLAAFQNADVQTAAGADFEDYFGYQDPDWFDESGNHRQNVPVATAYWW